MLIRDLVKVPPVRTVVRIADLRDKKLSRQLVENFVLTREVSFTIFTILDKIRSKEGQGFFVIGNYGSGKSHLLNVLSLLLNDQEAREIFSHFPEGHRKEDRGLLAALGEAAEVNPLTLEISLVEHSNREYLEEIVLSAANRKLRSQPGPAPGSLLKLPEGWIKKTRTEAFKTLQEALQKSGWGGLVLLVDELSEFLRSKPDARTYNEDVRFLQFLGEFAAEIPAWIVATLQENIENTGSIAQEMLHKIKDRYPVRFHLTGQHVKEIVSHRLVQKKDSALERLSEIYMDYCRSFNALPFTRDDFLSLYPVHPLTVELLDELRPLFSQHRGVVDFIHYRLAGDSRRSIEPFIERPAEQLLTPDYIFDHFRDRIRETVETSPYSEQVFRYFEREIGNIFSEEEDARTALRLLKILILGALVPGKKQFSPEELATLLLYRFTEMESQVNYEYIEELLEKLRIHGAYLRVEIKEDPFKGTQKRLYQIDLHADVSLLVKKKIDYLQSTLLPGEERVIKDLLPWVQEANLPLKELQKNPEQEREVLWQNTRRTGRIIFGSGETISPSFLEELRAETEKDEKDFVFFIAFPFYEEQELTLRLFPLLSGQEVSGKNPLAFWIPRGITKSEEEELVTAFSYHLLLQEYAADNSNTGLQVKEHLSGTLENQKRRVQEIFRALYYQGQLFVGRNLINPLSLSLRDFDSIIYQVASELLKGCFPRHAEICPQSELTGSVLQRALEHLTSALPEDEGLEKSSLMAVEKFLQPLGITKKRGQAYTMEINPKTSPLVAEFLSLIPQGGKTSLQDLYWKLRKGPFGLSKEGFQALGLAMILSGAITAFQGGRRLNPSKVNYYRFWKIEEVGPGSVIKPELQNVLATVPFLPERLKRLPLTFAAQQTAWEYVTEFKTELEEKLHFIRGKLNSMEEFRFFPTVDWRKMEKIFKRLQEFLDEIKISYTSQEGLERFLIAYQANPFLAEDLEKVESLHRFLTVDLENILRMGLYLKDPQLAIPAEEKYASLRQRYQLLLQMLEEESILWEEKYRERIRREYKAFLEEYTSCYLQEHEKALSPERIQPYRSLMESPFYLLLENFSRLNAVVVPNDIVSINKALSSVLARECDAARELLLKERPLCSCGFVLGEKVSFPLTSHLEAKIHQGIRQYIAALNQPEIKEQILRYLESLEEVGRRQEALPLKKLLQLKPDDPDLLLSLAKWFNRKAVDHLNQALTGDAMIVERSVDELKEMLEGRVFTAAQLEELFKTWLEGKEKKLPRYVRVIEKQEGEKRKLSSEDEERAGWEKREMVREAQFPAEKELLKARFPEGTSLLNKTGEKEFFMIALLSGWLKFHRLFSVEAAGKAAELLELKPSLWAGLEEKLARLGESMIREKESWGLDFLAKIARDLENKAGPGQLWELFLSSKAAADNVYHFDYLLEKMTGEPVFGGIVREISRRLTSQLQNEEIEGNLKVILSSLHEAQSSLQKEAKQSERGKPPLLKEKERALSFLESIARCNITLRKAEKGALKPPENDRDWENLYRHVSPFERELETLKEMGRPYGNPAALFEEKWKRLYTAALNILLEGFETSYQKEAPGKRLTLAGLLRHYGGWIREKRYSGGAYLLILDGARLDIWEALVKKMLLEIKLHLIKEGFTWATMPTVTAAQLEPLKDERLLGHIVNVDDGIISELLTDPLPLLQAVNNRPRALAGGERPKAFNALKFDFIDDKVHTSREDILTFSEEAIMQARKKLWPVVDNLPADSLVLLAADHGFRTNFHFSKYNKAEEIRYLHGGATFFEVLAPWALLEKSR